MLLTMPVITSQVFGNSGTRPFREVACEAETPRRSGSSAAQEESQAVPAKFAPVEALANALSEAQTSSDRSNALVQMVLQLDEVLHNSQIVCPHAYSVLCGCANLKNAKS